jgi:D-glycero-D-manno-heptose 1,7-bisphosphate phosphatase
MNRALFLDRDGVINKEVNYLYKIENCQFIDGSLEACLEFQKLGYLIIVVTNQSGIARGYYSERDFQIFTSWMIEQFERVGVNLAKVYYSPYHPSHGIGQYKKDSFCRKPNPGMILDAAREFDLDLKASILVGDSESDIQAGLNAGVGFCVLVRSGHSINENSTNANQVADSLFDFAVSLCGSKC